MLTKSGKNSSLLTQETHLNHLRGSDPASWVFSIKVKENGLEDWALGDPKDGCKAQITLYIINN